jgi:hypothetical protein
MFPTSSTIDLATPSTAELFIGWFLDDFSMFSHLSDEELLSWLPFLTVFFRWYLKRVRERFHLKSGRS